MKIHEFAQITGLSTKIIRYSESIGVLSSPKWMPNGYSGIAWMGYYLYGPDTTWEDVPSPLVSSSNTIYAERDEFRAQVTGLLKK